MALNRFYYRPYVLSLFILELLYEVEGKVLRTRVRIPPGPPKNNFMESIKKFIDNQLSKVDIEKQREIILNQSNEIEKQKDRILKLFSEGPDNGFDGVKSTDMDNTVGEDRKTSKSNRRK